MSGERGGRGRSGRKGASGWSLGGLARLGWGCRPGPGG